MKYEDYIWLMMWLLLLAGCTEDNEPESSQVNMSVSTRATSSNDALAIGVDEYRLRNIRIIVFNSDGSLDANFYDDQLPADAETYKSPYFPVSKSDGKKVCVVANELTTLVHAQLNAVNSYEDLKAVMYTLTDYIGERNVLLPSTGSYCLPMYGELDGVNVPARYNDVNALDIRRCVARVDVYMAVGDFSNVSIPPAATLQVSNTAKQGYFATGNLSAAYETTGRMQIVESDTTYLGCLYPASADDPGHDFDETDRYISFYLPEKVVAAGSELNLMLRGISLDDLGTTKDYSIKVNPQNAGKDKMDRNCIYKLYLKVAGADHIEVELHVTPWNMAGTQTSDVAADTKMTNCHIVAPGGRVHIPLAEVYKIWRDVFGEAIDPSATVTAEVLWDDDVTGEVVSRVTVEQDAGNYVPKYIKVETGATEGNAVVAMKVNGEVKWSWHIWNTTYEPNVAEGQEKTGGRIQMKRNLGDFPNTIKGCNYQMGRKDPFVRGSSWIPVPGTSYRENAIFSVENPTTRYSNWSSYYNSTPGLNYWVKSDHRKGIFDPCPDGWRAVKPATTRAVSWDEMPVRCIKDE